MAYRDAKAAVGARVEVLKDERRQVEAQLAELERLLRRKRVLDREIDAARRFIEEPEPAATPPTLAATPAAPKRRDAPRRKRWRLLAAAGLATAYAVVVTARGDPTPEPPACPAPAAKPSPRPGMLPALASNLMQSKNPLPAQSQSLSPRMSSGLRRR